MGTYRQRNQTEVVGWSIDEAVVRRINAYVTVTAVKNHPDNR